MYLFIYNTEEFKNPINYIIMMYIRSFFYNKNKYELNIIRKLSGADGTYLYKNKHQLNLRNMNV